MDKRMRLSKEEKQKMIDLYNQGLSTVQIGEIFNLKASNVAGYLKRGGVTLRSNTVNSRKYKLNHTFFENIDTEEKAYWLGFMYADGFLETDRPYLGIALSSVDEYHIEKFKKAVNSNYPIHQYNCTGYAEGKTYSKILMASEKMKSDLIRHGCLEKKTNILSAPDIDKEFVPHFIRGYFDGDGCLTCHTNKYNSIDWAIKILGTEDFLDYIKEFLQSKNIATIHQYYKRKNEQTVSSLEFGGNIQVEKFLYEIYKNSTVYLDRKYKKYKEFKNYMNSRAC